MWVETYKVAICKEPESSIGILALELTSNSGAIFSLDEKLSYFVKL